MGNNTYAVTPPRKPHKIFPIYSDEDITEDTEIEFVQVDKETALYYRDLFVHKLGTTLAEGYFLMLIDGKVNTTIGISMRDVFTLKSEYVGEVFGISRSSIKYKRLGKLFMMCLTSGDFKRFLKQGTPLESGKSRESKHLRLRLIGKGRPIVV
jgi:aspartyl-tRNA synthetase